MGGAGHNKFLPPVGRNLVNQRGAQAHSNTAGSYLVNREIQCSVCMIYKKPDMFAKRQQARIMDSFGNPYAPNGRTRGDPKVTCSRCTAGQTTELNCVICDKVMGLTAFSKNQRKTPDNARCIKCLEEQVDVEGDVPIYEQGYHSDNDERNSSDEDDDDEDFDRPTPSRPANSIRGADSRPTTTRASTNRTVASRPSTAATMQGDGWVDVETAAMKKLSLNAAQPLPARSRQPVQQPKKEQFKKNGWAKIDRVQKGKEKRWGEVDEIDEAVDEWANYGQEVARHRYGEVPGGKATKNNKKKGGRKDFDPNASSDDSD